MLKRIWSNKPLIGLIIFAIVVSILNPRFLTHANILNVLRQTSINSIIAVGMTLVILTMLRTYRSRFQIEFCFRDAKQYTGVKHCQARHKNQLEYSYNA